MILDVCREPFVKVICENTPPLRIAEAFFVAEQDMVALLKSRANDAGGADADALSANAGEVAMPDVLEIGDLGQRDVRQIDRINGRGRFFACGRW